VNATSKTNSVANIVSASTARTAYLSNNNKLRNKIKFME